MTDAYGTVAKDIKDKLLSTIKTASSFTTHAYADYIKSRPEGANPMALLKLVRDDLEAIATRETRHILQFQIWVQYLGDYSEATLDSIIGYAGEIVDAIEASRKLGSDYVENTEVARVDYSFREEQSAVLHHAMIVVQVEALRNL